MRTKQQERFGLWELAVLALLREAPMHPYQMQKLLRQRHKDEILSLKRGSLYHAIHRLEAAELIDAVRTARDGKRPERTTYRIAAAGKNALQEWMQQMIGVPKQESSDFMAALSFLPLLTVETTTKKLAERAAALEAEIAGMAGGIKVTAEWLPRIHLVESEYLLAMRKAELAWVRGLEADLRSGKLAWDGEEILKNPHVVKAREDAGKDAEPRRAGRKSK
ncbi:transcriptional regulator, PadR family [Candidatus Koribacter versatilis Ellin345]|uniref:Transcriptional regulator, PadR family n=1 Tax=Koribacter versatilis (strain Ellin345) TaxID=204669 RepID=Q1IIB1_KORVE|nr:PadR family transcriptional regulator [Candidatus Koribacter versatilis]ABF43389.1 transcriptional regulator, PadR family [Candidatus Koribacter versatilis Ellin345]